MDFSLTDPAIWASFLTLLAMEIVLGIDNVVFISLLAAKLPAAEAKKARQIGLSLALIMRIALLFSITWIIGLKDPVFAVLGEDLSWRDLILIGGGLFLLAKATLEIHHQIEGQQKEPSSAGSQAFTLVIAQIVFIDLVFSVDSILTAIGMADHLAVMIAAVTIAVGVMYVSSEPISRFIKTHPTTKVLALAFLVLIGAALVADGLGFHIPRGYIYAPMAFAALVEVLNILVRSGQKRAGA